MSREEAIEVLNLVEAYGLADEAKKMAIQALLDAAPSIKPQEPAHWTVNFTCSNCGCKCYPMDIDFGDYNYCPNCGREMEEGD